MVRRHGPRTLIFLASLATACAGSEQGRDERETRDDPVCGNGLREWSEQCDEGAENADDRTCTASCNVAICGDGLLLPMVESCDDGNRDDDDGCPADCAVCGDGVAQASESCDDGNAVFDDGCNDCKLPGEEVQTILAESNYVVDATSELYLAKMAWGPDTWIEKRALDGNLLASFTSPLTGQIFGASIPVLAVATSVRVAQSVDFTNTNAGGANIIVASFSRSGELEWSTQLEKLAPQFDEYANDLASASDGGVVLAGLVARPELENYGLVARLDAAGTVTWRHETQLGGTPISFVHVATQPSGDICVTGSTEVFYPPDAPSRRFLMCFTPEGELRWTVDLADLAHELVLDDDVVTVVEGIAATTYDLSTGTRTTAVSLSIQGAPILVERVDGAWLVLIHVEGGQQLVVLDLDGAERWRSEPTVSTDIRSIDIGDDGRLYACEFDAIHVYRPPAHPLFAPASGQLRPRVQGRRQDGARNRWPAR
jgi:cysteine-rich repeat protein